MKFIEFIYKPVDEAQSLFDAIQLLLHSRFYVFNIDFHIYWSYIRIAHLREHEREKTDRRNFALNE